MAQNTNPIFPLVPVNTWVSGTGATAGTPGLTANTTTDLTAEQFTARYLLAKRSMDHGLILLKFVRLALIPEL